MTQTERVRLLTQLGAARAMEGKPAPAFKVRELGPLRVPVVDGVAVTDPITLALFNADRIGQALGNIIGDATAKVAAQRGMTVDEYLLHVEVERRFDAWMDRLEKELRG